MNILKKLFEYFNANWIFGDKIIIKMEDFPAGTHLIINILQSLDPKNDKSPYNKNVKRLANLWLIYIEDEEFECYCPFRHLDKKSCFLKFGSFYSHTKYCTKCKQFKKKKGWQFIKKDQFIQFSKPLIWLIYFREETDYAHNRWLVYTLMTKIVFLGLLFNSDSILIQQIFILVILFQRRDWLHVWRIV